MNANTETTSPAIIDSNDPRAVLRAWMGGTQDMGGWPNADRAAFRAALDAEVARISGGEVESFDGDIEAAPAAVVLEILDGITLVDTTDDTTATKLQVLVQDLEGTLGDIEGVDWSASIIHRTRARRVINSTPEEVLTALGMV